MSTSGPVENFRFYRKFPVHLDPGNRIILKMRGRKRLEAVTRVYMSTLSRRTSVCVFRSKLSACTYAQSPQVLTAGLEMSPNRRSHFLDTLVCHAGCQGPSNTDVNVCVLLPPVSLCTLIGRDRGNPQSKFMHWIQRDAMVSR